jgi:peptidoglycan/xylan/chitin deacetylase (PgdA/CDA1 family)
MKTTKIKYPFWIYLLAIFAIMISAPGCEKDDNIEVPGPLFVFGFDDGFDTDYHLALREFKLRGVRGISFINTGVIGTPGALTWQMIHQMVEDGWEIGCHTHSHLNLAQSTVEEMRAEFETVDSLYRVQNLPVPKHLTYPYGATDDIVMEVSSEYRLSGRTANSATNDYSNGNFNFMRYKWVHADMRNENGPDGLNSIKEQVDMAFQEKTVLVSFLMHRVVGSNPVGYEVGLVYLQQLLDYIIERGGTIVTMNEAYEIIQETRQQLPLE